LQGLRGPMDSGALQPMAVQFSLAAGEKPSPKVSQPFHCWLTEAGDVWTEFYRSPDGFVVRFPGIADFRLSHDATQCSGVPCEGVSGATLEQLFRGVVTPLALSAQGQCVVHAAAVEVGEECIAFAGSTGRGKSTLTAFFARNGHRFLSDDAVVLEAREDGLRVHPGAPSLRLWSDSHFALVPHLMPAPAVEYTAKGRFLAGDALHCAQPRRLRHFFFLGDAAVPDVRIKRLHGSAVVLELVKNSFVLDVEAKDTLKRQFETTSRFGDQPVFYRLDFPRSYGVLEELRTRLLAGKFAAESV
jgi:hypothetical protein